MRKRDTWLWVIYGLVLLFLYLISSTDLLIKERKNEIYPVSVILDDTTDESYQNFKKGVDRAAIELNADVSMITLYEGGDASQQIERMAREQQDGARALIVMPVEESALESALADKRVQIPLVLVNAELPRDKVSAVVSTDYDAMGGCEIKKFERHGDGSIRKIVEELVYPESAQAVIIALDAETLLETAQILADSSVYPEHVSGLYGRGTATPLLNYLDRGVISGLSVTDDFSTGYLSVRRAVEILSNQKTEEATVLESYYIRKEDLRSPEFEKMLYPIE